MMTLKRGGVMNAFSIIFEVVGFIKGMGGWGGMRGSLWIKKKVWGMGWSERNVSERWGEKKKKGECLLPYFCLNQKRVKKRRRNI